MLIADKESYYESRLTDQSLRRFWPIDDRPACYKEYHSPTVRPGDLVVWKNSTQDTLPIFSRKKLGLVLQTRWVLADWLPDDVGIHVMPEARIYWNDGETTNSAHNSVESAP